MRIESFFIVFSHSANVAFLLPFRHIHFPFSLPFSLLSASPHILLFLLTRCMAIICPLPLFTAKCTTEKRQKGWMDGYKGGGEHELVDSIPRRPHPSLAHHRGVPLITRRSSFVEAHCVFYEIPMPMSGEKRQGRREAGRATSQQQEEIETIKLSEYVVGQRQQQVFILPPRANGCKIPAPTTTACSVLHTHFSSSLSFHCHFWKMQNFTIFFFLCPFRQRILHHRQTCVLVLVVVVPFGVQKSKFISLFLFPPNHTLSFPCFLRQFLSHIIPKFNIKFDCANMVIGRKDWPTKGKRREICF